MQQWGLAPLVYCGAVRQQQAGGRQRIQAGGGRPEEGQGFIVWRQPLKVKHAKAIDMLAFLAGDRSRKLPAAAAFHPSTASKRHQPPQKLEKLHPPPPKHANPARGKGKQIKKEQYTPCHGEYEAGMKSRAAGCSESLQNWKAGKAAPRARALSEQGGKQCC